MATELRIGRNTATKYRIDVENEQLVEKSKTLNSDDFARRVAHKVAGSMIRKTGMDRHPVILPKNCRIYKKLDYYVKLLVIEEDPAFRTIFTDLAYSWAIDKAKEEGNYEKYGIKEWKKENKGNANKINKFLLAFPYVIYMMTIGEGNNLTSMKVFLRTTPIRSMSDYLCIAPLNNIGSQQKVCLGHYDVDVRSEMSAAEGYINAFWSNTFNNDYIYNTQDYKAKVPELSDPFTWQYLSQADPMFVYKAGWIKYKITIGQMINKMIKGIESRSSGRNVSDIVWNFNFHSLITSFSHSLETDLVYSPANDNISPEKIEDNQADSEYFNDTIAYQGDQFSINGKTYFIDSFLGPPMEGIITHVRLLREDKKKLVMKLNTKTIKYLEDKLIENRHKISHTLPNGTELNRGDIIEIDYKMGSVLKKIDYFTYGLEGHLEMKTHNHNYIVEAFQDKITKIDISSICGDLKLKEGTSYYFVRFSDNRRMYYKIVTGEYIGIDVDSSGALCASFRNNIGIEKTSIEDLRNQKSKIISQDMIGFMSGVFRMGPTIKNVLGDNDENGFFIPSIGLALRRFDELTSVSAFSKIKSHVLYNDKRTFYLDSCDGLDICFSIGDKVVTYNQFDRIDMLKIKTVVGIRGDLNTQRILVSLQDKYNTITEFPIIETAGDVYAFNVNQIRHIELEYNGITAGSKIKAKKGGRISNFPLKDTNIIIGFLSDTFCDVPLALCSNGCTLWADELEEKFDIIEMSDPKWKKYNHCPIHNNIKLQAGDYLKTPGSTYYYLGYTNYNTAPFLFNALSYGVMHDEYPLDQYMKTRVFHAGFPTPRYSERQSANFPAISGFPTFQGAIIEHESSRVKFYVDPRRVIKI